MRFGAILLFGLLLSCEGALAKAKPQVTFESACVCEGAHGVARWAAKTDPVEPPQDASQITPITPAQIFEWSGPGGNLPRGGGRIPAEQQWYAVTGRVSKLRAEDDGDIHIVLANVDSRPGTMVVEIPVGEAWCQLRQMAFGWTNVQFPFATARNPFRLVQHPVITVIGRAFYDTDHGGDTRNNRRAYDRGLAVWEIHPVMKILQAGVAAAAAAAPTSSATPVPVVITPSATAAGQIVTITKPVVISIPYGVTTLPAGIKLPMVSRSGDSVTVRYMGGDYRVPVASTDLRP